MDAFWGCHSRCEGAGEAVCVLASCTSSPHKCGPYIALFLLQAWLGTAQPPASRSIQWQGSTASGMMPAPLAAARWVQPQGRGCTCVAA